MLNDLKLAAKVLYNSVFNFSTNYKTVATMDNYRIVRLTYGPFSEWKIEKRSPIFFWKWYSIMKWDNL